MIIIILNFSSKNDNNNNNNNNNNNSYVYKYKTIIPHFINIHKYNRFIVKLIIYIIKQQHSQIIFGHLVFTYITKFYLVNISWTYSTCTHNTHLFTPIYIIGVSQSPLLYFP